MAFTLSGSIITQTGTDTSLSGLTSISDVVKTTQGASTREFSLYDIGNRKLVVSGTLSINAPKEQLLIGSSAPRNCLIVRGTLNINDTETINGFVRTQKRVAVKTTYSRPTCCSDYSLEVSATGSLIMRGGAIEMASSVYFHANSTIDIENGRIELAATPSANYHIRQYSNNFKATNFELVKYAMTMVGKPVLFTGYTSTQCNAGIGFSGDSSADEYIFKDFGGGHRGNLRDFALWASKKCKVINSKTGTDIVVANNVANSASTGTVSVFKEITTSITDNNGAINDAVVFIRDTDNGNRTDGNGYTFSPDRTYYETVTNGKIPTTSILLGVVNEPSYDASPDFDYRGVNGDNSDIFNVHICSYLHKYKRVEMALKGLGTADISEAVFADTKISQKDMSIVSTYTTIDSASMLYDYLKYLKTLEANIEKPSIDKQLLAITGTAATISSGYSLVRDQSLSGAPVQVTGTQIKVKTGANGLRQDTTADNLSGTVTASFDGHTTLVYVNSNGKVNCNFSGIDNQNFGHNLSAVFYKLPADANWTKQSVSGDTGTIEVTANTDYNIKVYSAGYTHQEFNINSGDFGISKDVKLVAVKDKNGANIYTKTINQTLYNAASYDTTTRSMLITIESTTEQQTYDFNTAFRILEDTTHNEYLIGTFADAIYINVDVNGFIVPLGNFLSITKSSATPKVHLGVLFEREDGTSIEIGAIKKLDGTDLEVGGVKRYHLQDGITVTNLTQTNTVTNVLTRGVFDSVVNSIPAKVNEAVTDLPTTAGVRQIVNNAA